MNYSKLIEEAIKAKEFSYSPYSNFKVGAAILGKNGKIYNGTNVECAAFFSSCAERTAAVKAISEGEKEFAAIAIVGGNEECFPCGMCRQFLVEFSPEMEVVVAKSKTDYKIFILSDLLPNFYKRKI